MQQLPIEIFIQVFKHLNLNDLLRCRQVNKTWNESIKKFVEITSVAVKEEDGYFTLRKYSFNYEPIEEISCIFETNNEHFLKSQFMLQLLQKNLKQLCIDLNDSCSRCGGRSSFVDDLNKFYKLEHLQIISMTISNEKAEILKLNNLERLTIMDLKGQKLILDTPSLHSFQTEQSLRSFKFNYPTQMRTLYLDKYCDMVKKFTNLEYLYSTCLGHEDFNTLENIDSLPNLKELHSKCIDFDTMDNILSNANRLARPNFNFYYNGLRIETFAELFEFEEEFQMNPIGFDHLLDNYDRLANISPMVYNVNYSSLTEYFNGEIDPNFFKRFVNIQQIDIDRRIIDTERLIEFLKGCKSAIRLNFKNTSLGQRFFDQLHLHVPHIRNLEIWTDKKLNLEFLLKFKALIVFKINQTTSFEMITKIFKNLAHFGSFNLCVNDSNYEIDRKTMHCIFNVLEDDDDL